MISVKKRNSALVKLNFIDLQILYLGEANKGRFDETDIENSDLKNLGVGRILDHLASLKDRKLLEMHQNGSFSISGIAKHTLWDSQIPLWVRILRILEIKSMNLEKLASFLFLTSKEVLLELEDLRRNQLVLMAPLRTERGIEKMYEILPEGIKQIEKGQFKSYLSKQEFSKPPGEILSLIEEIIREIKKSEGISKENKEKIISKILRIKDKLEI